MTNDTQVWKGADNLTDLLRPIEDLILLPGNPRQGDVGAISESLERFGQLKPVVLNNDNVILAGNHTYLAASALGWTHVAAVIADLEGREQTGFALADNRLSDLASYDNDALLEMLTQAGDLYGTGYDIDDMDEIRLQLNEPLNFEQYADTDTRLDETKGSGRIACPECGHEFQWKDRAKPESS